jgi:hypothetical protein
LVAEDCLSGMARIAGFQSPNDTAVSVGYNKSTRPAPVALWLLSRAAVLLIALKQSFYLLHEEPVAR